MIESQFLFSFSEATIETIQQLYVPQTWIFQLCLAQFSKLFAYAFGTLCRSFIEVGAYISLA